jgi:hypothetical protein
MLNPELTNTNLLTNKEEYFFVIDERMTPLEMEISPKRHTTSIDGAYSIGIHIIKKTELEQI